MHPVVTMTIAETKQDKARGWTTQVLAGTGLAAGVLASPCCLLPLLLLSVGVGGAWMSRLTALAPYQPLFLGMAAIALGWGFWRSYRRRDCSLGSSCDRPGALRITRILLCLGAILAFTATCINLILPWIL
jgi:mercuric ion transport protein